MRDFALLFILFPMLYSSLRYVHTSVMFWIWTALAAPSAFLFGFLVELPLNKIAVAGPPSRSSRRPDRADRAQPGRSFSMTPPGT